jgi:hypothetical protein
VRQRSAVEIILEVREQRRAPAIHQPELTKQQSASNQNSPTSKHYPTRTRQPANTIQPELTKKQTASNQNSPNSKQHPTKTHQSGLRPCGPFDFGLNESVMNPKPET